MKTKRYITSKISHIKYQCPHCGKVTSYDTDGIPVKNDCHSCLKKIDFEDVNV